MLFLIGAQGANSNLNGDCKDVNGRIVEHGLHYVPGPDTCRLCICDNGYAKGCKAVLCTPPSDCKSFQIGSTCCEFLCLDETLANNNSDRNSDFGI